MVRLFASSSTCGAGLRAAQILRARQFVARVIDHLIRLDFGRSVRKQPGYLSRQHNHHEKEKGLDHPGSQQTSIGKNAVGSLPSQPFTRATESGTDRSNELAPGRGPLHQELGRIVALDRRFELEGMTHAGETP